jgi:hypothetical protein
MDYLTLKKANKYFIPFFALFITGCGVGTGIQSASIEHEPDLFSTFPKDFDSPYSISWTSGVIEVEDDKYEVQEFKMILEESPVDPNAIKLTIDVKTPDTKPQRMSIYTTKDDK